MALEREIRALRQHVVIAVVVQHPCTSVMRARRDDDVRRWQAMVTDASQFSLSIKREMLDDVVDFDPGQTAEVGHHPLVAGSGSRRIACLQQKRQAHGELAAGQPFRDRVRPPGGQHSATQARPCGVVEQQHYSL